MNFYLLASGPGQKLQESLGGEIGSLFLLVCMGLALYYFFQRAFTKFISFVLFAMLVAVFIYSPSLIEAMGTDGFNWLFGDLIR